MTEQEVGSKAAVVVVAGSGAKHNVDITPGVTTRDLLEQLGLEGKLRKYEDTAPFGENEELFDRIEDGEKLILGPFTPVGVD